MRLGWGAGAIVIAATLLCGEAVAAPQQPAHPNPANDKLMKLPPAERAAVLARVVGHWCIATEAFPMGVVVGGRGDGYAYWSVRCANGSAWAVQINPAAEYVAIECAVFKENGAGRECFKKF